jgi:hypothetical protein
MPPAARRLQLRRKIPDCPGCPPKKMFGSHTPEFLEQRRLELVDWVRQVRVCDKLRARLRGSA